MGDNQKEWLIRCGGALEGPFTEFELRQRLMGSDLNRLEVKQGESRWFPAKSVWAKFKELARAGIFLRHHGETEGPFTAARALETLRQSDTRHVEAKVGPDGFWIAGQDMLDHLERLAGASAKSLDSQNGAPSDKKLRKRKESSPTRGRKATTKRHRSGLAAGKLRLKCPNCRAALLVDESAKGMIVRCASCQRLMKVFLSADSTAKHSEAKSSDAETSNSATSNSAPSTGSNLPDTKTLQPNGRAIDRHAHPDSESPKLFGSLAVNNGDAKTLGHGRLGNELETSDRVQADANPVQRDPESSADFLAYPRLPNQQNPAMYIVPGVFIAIWGFVMFIGTLIGIFTDSQGVTEVASQVVPEVAEVGFLADLVVNLVMMTLYVMMTLGAITMVMRKNMTLSRASAVLATIPCVGCFIAPFGIWACVALFTRGAERDFS